MRLRDEQQDSLRFIPTGKVVELLILPERGDAGRHIGVAISEQHNYSIAPQVANQARAALVENGERLMLPSVGRKRSPQNCRQDQTRRDKNLPAFATSVHRNPLGK